mmetsp:Transcript_23556/g.23756  ORF Transcript_23556/g.23756 Transcript_23556/m.23756 type:complete len:352 (+) Transcript_23556:49-1104(+)
MTYIHIFVLFLASSVILTLLFSPQAEVLFVTFGVGDSNSDTYMKRRTEENVLPALSVDYDPSKLVHDEILAELYHKHQLDERYIDKRTHSDLVNINPNFPCVYGTTPVGLDTPQSVSDGHKFLCGVRYISGPPIVYSFGSFKRDDFEKGFLSIRPDAEIHVFELISSNLPKENDRDERVNYHHIGLGGYGKRMLQKEPSHDGNRGMNRGHKRKGVVKKNYLREKATTTLGMSDEKVMTLHQIMKSLGHTYIDVLKMDVEGMEWEFIEKELYLFNRIGQYAVEIHVTDHVHWKNDKYKTGPTGYFIGKLEENNMRLFHRENNMFGPQCCQEYSLIQKSWSSWNAEKSRIGSL